MAAGYDGSIRIDTRVDTTGFQRGIHALPKQLSGLTRAAGVLGAALTAAFAVDKIVAMGKEAINLASDLQEVENVVTTAFGDMTYMVEDFADTAIEKFGMSELAAKRTASTYMAMSKSMGITGKAAAEMSIAVAGLSGDVASFFNVSQDVADTALKSIWTGETETLKQFGVVMTQANLQQFAYQQGIKKKIAAMSQAEQVQLRYMYVMQQLSLAQGDFARTSSSWANQTRILSENWKELLGILGNGLIEILLPVVQFLNVLVKGLIMVAKGIGAVYRMLTGKEMTTQTDKVSDSLGNLSDSAADATENQYGLADGINAAGAAAKNALANFDDLDVLQRDLGNNGGGGGGGSFDVPSFSFDAVDFGETEKNVKDFTDDIKDILIGWRDDLQEDFVIQPVIEEPVIPPLPSPVWEPNWGLVPPDVPVPEFPSLPSPVWEPNWGLVPTLEVEFALANQILGDFQTEMVEGLSVGFEKAQKVYDTAVANTAAAFANAKQNFVTTKDTVIENAGIWVTETSRKFQTWKQNVTTAVYDTARNTIDNWNTALETTAGNAANWINNTSKNFVTWGEGILKTSWNTAKGFADNMINGFKTVWENFKSLMSSIGEKVSGAWEENKNWLAPTLAVGAAVAVGAGIILSGGSLAPALGAAAFLANGAVIPPNQEFLAVLGDQKSGRNLEAPEGLIRQIMREELAGLMGGGEVNVNIEFSGSLAQLARVLHPAITKEQKRIGGTLQTGGVL